MLAFAKCPSCKGTGELRRWWRTSQYDGGAIEVSVRICSACDGNGGFDVSVAELDADLVHDAAVDAVEARGFFVGDER